MGHGEIPHFQNPESTPEEVAQEWVGWLREEVRRLDEMDGIDTERAVRGIIVGDISGDGIGRLISAGTQREVKDLIQEEDRESIVNGIRISWLLLVNSIKEFGDRLPTRCQQAFESVISDHRGYIEEIFEDQSYDLIEACNRGYDLNTDIKAVEVDSPGMRKSDIGYALWVNGSITHFQEED